MLQDLALDGIAALVRLEVFEALPETYREERVCVCYRAYQPSCPQTRSSVRLDILMIGCFEL